jgi:hypothetical protein
MIKHRTSGAARCCRIVLVGALGVLPAIAHSQALAATSTPVPTPAQLSRYDANRNGVFEATELAAMQADQAAGTGDAILLTPFEVSTDQDRGYAAGNTLSGGRVDTPLAITPSAISVMTKEFLEDFAITDINEAAQWTMNMDTSGNPTQGPFGGDRFESNFRGAGGQGSGSYPTRDGIQQYFVADSYNSERFEISSGPNAAMAGIGGPGGMQGSSSKRVRFNNRSGNFSTRVDSFGGYRGTIDYNYGIDRLGVRVNGLHQNIKGFQDGTSNKQNAITAAVGFRISEKTLLTAQYEKSSEWNIQYRRTWGEQASFWDRTTVNTNNTLLPVTPAGQPGTGLSLISQNNDRLTYNFGTNSIVNYRGAQYQTTGLGYQIPWGGRPDLPQQWPGSANFKPGMGKDFFLGPADNIADRDNNTRMVALDHIFTPNLTARLTWQSSDIDPATLYSQGHPGDYRIDVNRLLPDGSINPNYLQAYSEWTQNSQYQQNGNDEYVAMVNYRFGVPRWFDLQQRFNVNIGYRDAAYEAWNRSWRRTNNPAQLNPTNGVNQLRFRQYYGQGRGRMIPILYRETLNSLMPGTTWENIGTGFHAFNTTKLTYGQIYSQTTLFNERLAIAAGLRRDKVQNDNTGNIGNDPAKDYAIIMGAVNPATGLQEEGFHSKLTTLRTSKNVGAVVYPFPDRWRWLRPLGFVFNFSQNFQIPPTGGPFYTGERPTPPFSETTDYAIRYSIPGGVAYAEIRRYDTTQLGQLSNMQNTGDIGDIWENLGYTEDNLVNFGGYRDTADRKLSGTEFELTLNPTRNWTMRANYGHPTVKTVVERKFLREYVATHIAEWRAGAAAAPGTVLNGRTVVDPILVAQNIQDIENSFNGLSSGTIGNGPRHRASIASSYRFTEGRLRGVGVSGGLSWRGSSKAGSRDARLKFQTTNPTPAQNREAAFDYLWVPSQVTNNIGVNYTRRFGKYTARFQLNVTNILNDDDPLWSSYSTINAGQLTNQSDGNALAVPGSNPRMQVLSGFSNPEPRKFVFTTTVSF